MDKKIATNHLLMNKNKDTHLQIVGKEAYDTLTHCFLFVIEWLC